ncbi:MAG: Rid family hydrolase [Proteobacteria bacterium]|nr:Rid family hydrolase [Pseudomonadota bacterium]
MTVEPLLPVELGQGKIRYAQGVKAGRWVFVTGCMAQNFADGIAPGVIAQPLPHGGLPKREKEAGLIFDHIARVLSEGGTDLSNLVRTDQYYTTVEAVPPYQAVRRRTLGQLIPPSTSIAMQRFVLPDADMNLQAIAIVPEDGFQVDHLHHRTIQSRPTSGYSPALTAGDFVFLPGSTTMAMVDEPSINGVAAAARMPEGMQWGGQPIKLETEFIVTERIAPSLELAGSRLEDVVKAQIYLTDPNDYSAFNEAWARHFGEDGPALSVIPCIERGLAVIDGKIEINILALKSNGATKKQHIDAGIVPGFRHQPQAVKAGDMLFLSGLMAIDENGLKANARPDPHQPWFGSSAAAQAEIIIDHASRLCEAAGTSIANAVRIQQFHTDMSEFYPVYKAWERTLDGAPVPFAAVEIPSPLPVPGATLLMDIWVYCP